MNFGKINSTPNFSPYIKLSVELHNLIEWVKNVFNLYNNKNSLRKAATLNIHA